ncbi:MAG TPA: hypothetical protein DCS45_15990 [Roseovarius nubinhibens]|uniref:Uncharacterized protein n=1 Tax=Roseovarius nubinhibens TaxID=314263 RepID=A0A348WFP4_9RHOB|nr:hypothetical protein [Roseovarius nubinhibens]|tara:strand:- start:15111 stop:15620 length:510 start_codon:yes stop_codon:yes gene_type:complete
MQSGIPNLIDALKDGDSGVLLGAAGAGAVVWFAPWPIQWISYLGLVVFVFSGVFLSWKVFDWQLNARGRAQSKRSMSLYLIAGNVNKMESELRLFADSRRGQNAPLAHKLSALYAELRLLGFETPSSPNGDRYWDPKQHIRYFEAISPYLKPSLFKDARRVAKTEIESK